MGGGEGRRKYQKRVCDEKAAQRAQRAFLLPDACRTPAGRAGASAGRVLGR
jgi:hypothetical protein